ncbi:MAG: hypothetical protein J6L65_05515 [Lachnospiraceae bacterium]|nr:hypothetical protein [Lachnospiraceae bacterium]
MAFESILDLHRSSYKDELRPSFYVDFNVDQIIDRICRNWGENISSFYYYLPADRESEDYRREVMADVKIASLNEALMGFERKMKRHREIVEKKEFVKKEIQKAAWHISEVLQYGEALQELLAALQETDIRSQGMLSLKESLETYLASEEFQTMYRQAEELVEERKSLRFHVSYAHNQVVVSEGEIPGTYDTFLKDNLTEPEKPMKSPFVENPDLVSLELLIMEILQKKKPELFKKTVDFYEKYKDYTKEVYIQLGKELAYYLAFYKFEEKMQKLGFAFTAPTVDEAQDMFATGLYDLALAYVNSEDGKEVTANDVVYHEGETFIVLTGPNQGGKTTFARSLGQMMYFTKMGLDVPAMAANVHHFNRILTHFTVEESVETGRGKLQEELVRLKPMMNEESTNDFVIINELFTTAANYDAIIMGQRVLQHFIGQNCRGIYVTHLKELTEAHESVVSMRAMLDEQGKQNHRIVRKEAEDIACAINQVNKYRLKYEQLKERLS